MIDSDYGYHWTHKSLLASVLETALDPEFAQGKMKVVWWCEWSKVGYALGHIAARHGWAPDDMVLIRFVKHTVPYANTAYPGIYTTAERIKLRSRAAVKLHVLGEWVTARTLCKDIDRLRRI